MAETLKTSFKPWRYILIVAVLVVLLAVITGATNILGLTVDLVVVLAVVALIWFVCNVVERRKKVREIDTRLAEIGRQLASPAIRTTPNPGELVEERDALRTKRATLTGWFVQ